MGFKFQMELKKSRGSVRDPEVLVTGKMSHVRMHFTPHVYNNLCNISQLLSSGNSSTTEHEDQQHLVNGKNQVMAMSTKSGIVIKEGAGYQTISLPMRDRESQQKYFTVLSGAYLYFYGK